MSGCIRDRDRGLHRIPALGSWFELFAERGRELPLVHAAVLEFNVF